MLATIARKAAAEFRKAHKLAPGDPNGEALLKALGAGTVDATVSYTITSQDAAGPFLETIPALESVAATYTSTANDRKMT